jgi:hypothetical protein
MSNYTKTTDFAAKDSLPSGDSGKIIKGAEFETEFDAISTAIATKSDIAGPTFTGTLTFETISDGSINVTAFVDEDNMASDSATLVPTQQSVKAYVDTTVAATNEVVEDSTPQLGGTLDLNGNNITGTGNIDVTGTVTSDGLTVKGDATIGDLSGGKLGIAGQGINAFATTTEPSIYRTGSGGSDIFSLAGHLVIQPRTSAARSVNIATSSDGVSTIKRASFADNGDIKFYEDTGTTPKLQWLASDEDLKFADNSKAVFGAGSDLQIYHDGTSSYVEDAGSGNLILKSNGSNIQFRDVSDNIIFKSAPNATTLYYAAAERLATSSTGVDVSGTLTADDVSLNTKAVIGGATPRIELFESDTTDVNTRFRNTGGTLQIQSTDDVGTTSQTRIAIDHATGDISFREDTGTDDKFYWDASAESLGIGNTAPQAGVHVTQDATQLILAGAAGSNDKFIAFDVDLIADVNTHFITVDQADALAFGEKLNDNDRVIENEWMRITNSGKVGIGTDSPTAKVHSVSSDALPSFLADGGTGDFSVPDGQAMQFAHWDGSSTATERMRINSSGYLIVPNGITLGTAVGTYAAANTLDDYEEGTFTPVIADASSGGNTGTATTAEGFYTKIGRQVVVVIKIEDIDTTGMTGANNIFIRGLPFVAGSGATGQSQGSLRLDRADLDANCCGIVCSSTSNSSYLTLRQTVDNSADVQIKVQDFTSGSADLFATITYFV